MNLSVKFVQDVDLAISVMRNAGEWLLLSGKNPSKWWQPQNMNREFLLQYANPDEFYVGLIDGKPAVAAIFQFDQRNQDWTSIDKSKHQKALYVHWLCVHRHFAGMGLPEIMVDFAQKKALENNIKLLRVDTNAAHAKLRRIYEDLGFTLVGIEQEDYRKTAFYQRRISLDKIPKPFLLGCPSNSPPRLTFCSDFKNSAIIF